MVSSEGEAGKVVCGYVGGVCFAMQFDLGAAVCLCKADYDKNGQDGRGAGVVCLFYS